MTTCFVAMGFGEKTAFYGGKKKQRTPNLDKTYENIIKPAVLAAGFGCVRADEILHSTLIDKPMYEQLHQADIVIADLSTSNANAIYELGVRHALRPHATIVMAETNFKFPFDLNHVSILTYRHLGEDIGASEAKRVKELLKAKLAKIKAATEVDSPVYLFLPSLAGIDVAPAEPAAAKTDESLAEMRERLRKQKEGVGRPADWLKVIATLHEMEKLQPNDPFVTQQLALATYKSEYPDKATSLRDAKEILYKLLPTTSSDAETVGLWGAIHKRLWEVDGNRNDLDKAIGAYS